MKTVKKLLSICLLFFLATAQAKITYDINEPNIVARMGELTLSKSVVELFWQSYNHPSRPISPPQAMQRIIDEALLAEYARNNLPKEALYTENKVGFALSVQQEDRTIALIRKANENVLKDTIQKLPGGSLDGIYSFNKDFTKEKYQQIFALESKVNIEATTKQIDVAKRTIVATLRLDNRDINLSLWDIYQRQNVQGRLSMHNGELEHLKAEVRQRVGSLFIMHWAEKELPSHDLMAIKQIVRNEQDKNSLLKSMGLYADVHDDNPVLREKSKSVSEKEILSFYEENKEEFAVVEKVKARHIQVKDQALADKIHHELEEGLSFEKAVVKYSIAADKNKPVPGDLGWLKRSDKNRTWLHSVAFTQKKGQLSVPFRSPQNQGEIVYEIIKVDDRIDGYLAVTDPTVHYEASRDIALKKLKNDFLALQKALRENADIKINKNAFPGRK